MYMNTIPYDDMHTLWWKHVVPVDCAYNNESKVRKLRPFFYAERQTLIRPLWRRGRVLTKGTYKTEFDCGRRRGGRRSDLRNQETSVSPWMLQIDMSASWCPRAWKSKSLEHAAFCLSQEIGFVVGLTCRRLDPFF